MRVQVKSVSFFTRASGLSDLAQVRYVKALAPGCRCGGKFSHWVATVQYAYTEPAKDPKTRALESAGLQDRRLQVGAGSAARNRRSTRTPAMIDRIRTRDRAAICCVTAVRANGALYSLHARVAEIVPARGPWIAAYPLRIAYDGEQVYRLRGFVGYQIDLRIRSRERPSSGSGAGDIDGLVLFRSGQSPVLEAEGGEGGDQSDRAHQSPALSVRLHRRCRSVPRRTIRTSSSRCGSSTRRPPRNRCGCGGKAHRLRTRRCLGEAAAEHRLLVLRKPDVRPVAASDDGVHTRLRFAANAICRRSSCATPTAASRCSISAWMRAM